MADLIDVAAIEEVHDLYRIDPSEFVEARASLVKQLRAEGRKDEAKAVVKLRKPSVASWALDQVAVDQPELIEAALGAVAALQVATTETLEGDASNLRSAPDAERTAVSAVTDAAAVHLPTLTADHRERMMATLRAAITDEAVRSQLTAGLLATDHEPPPMGFVAASADAATAVPRDAAPTKGAAKAKRSAAAELAEPPEAPARAKRKVRRVGTPSAAGKAPVDEVEARRRAKEVERLQAEEAERKRAEAQRAEERRRQQAALDAAATEARSEADRLEGAARTAERAATAARAHADAASAAAAQAEAAAAAGPTV
jgi:hypothetical protein